MSKEMETLSDAERRDRLRKTERRERGLFSRKKKGREEEEGRMVQTKKKEK